MDALVQQLLHYSAKNMISFHTPGHKGRQDLLEPLRFPDYDLTELPDLDMLHNPQGVIAQAQQKAAQAYGADASYFLVNGATAGNQAILLALASSLKGKKLRIERNAHRSVSSALILSGIEPEYVQPIIHPLFNLPLGFDSKALMAASSNLGAWHITSPTYYGTQGSLEKIIQRRNSETPHIPICVDQAHGAHYHGPLFPANAITQGADLVVHSTHKTLRALTQAGMLHLRGMRIDKQSLEKALEMILTSSPNYLLMASLENAIADLNKPQEWEDLYEAVKHLQAKLEGSLRILTEQDIGSYGIEGVDWSKILVNVSSLEVSASKIVQILRSAYHIEPELWDEGNILFILGSGSRPAEVFALEEALLDIVYRYPTKSDYMKYKNKASSNIVLSSLALPPRQFTPRQAWFAPKRIIRIRDSLGRVSGETISVYPPGVPIIVAGEEITEDILFFLTRAENYKWQGWQGFNKGEIMVIDV